MEKEEEGKVKEVCCNKDKKDKEKTPQISTCICSLVHYYLFFFAMHQDNKESVRKYVA